MTYLSMPVGTAVIDAPIVVQSDTLIHGCGPGTVVTCTGDFPAFVVGDGTKAHNVTIRDLRITRTNMAGAGTPQAESHGVVVWGEDVEIRDVVVDDCFTAVRTVDVPADPSRRVSLRRVRYRHSAPNANTSIFGFWFDTVEHLLVEDCTSRGTWLDGLKLRKRCVDVRVVGGSYCASLHGDGIDAYSGAGRLTIRDVMCDDHVFGSGINVKVSDLSGAEWGRPVAVEIDGCRCRRNATVGLVVNRDAAASSRPHAAHILIRGGEFSENTCGNGSNGAIHIDARSVEIDGVLAANNGGPGLWLRADSRDVRVRGGRFAGNGTIMALKVNMVIDGKRIVVEHPILLGRDGAVANDAELDALPGGTDLGVLCQASSDDVTLQLRDADGRGHGAVQLLTVSGGAGRIILHGEGAGAPSGAQPGAVGSTFVRTDGGPGASLYVKESGPANSRVGWASQTR